MLEFIQVLYVLAAGVLLCIALYSRVEEKAPQDKMLDSSRGALPGHSTSFNCRHSLPDAGKRKRRSWLNFGKYSRLKPDIDTIDEHCASNDVRRNISALDDGNAQKVQRTNLKSVSNSFGSLFDLSRPFSTLQPKKKTLSVSDTRKCTTLDRKKRHSVAVLPRDFLEDFPERPEVPVKCASAEKKKSIDKLKNWYRSKLQGEKKVGDNFPRDESFVREEEVDCVLESDNSFYERCRSEEFLDSHKPAVQQRAYSVWNLPTSFAPSASSTSSDSLNSDCNIQHFPVHTREVYVCRDNSINSSSSEHQWRLKSCASTELTCHSDTSSFFTSCSDVTDKSSSHSSLSSQSDRGPSISREYSRTLDHVYGANLCSTTLLKTNYADAREKSNDLTCTDTKHFRFRKGPVYKKSCVDKALVCNLGSQLTQQEAEENVVSSGAYNGASELKLSVGYNSAKYKEPLDQFSVSSRDLDQKVLSQIHHKRNRIDMATPDHTVNDEILSEISSADVPITSEIKDVPMEKHHEKHQYPRPYAVQEGVLAMGLGLGAISIDRIHSRKLETAKLDKNINSRLTNLSGTVEDLKSEHHSVSNRHNSSSIASENEKSFSSLHHTKQIKLCEVTRSATHSPHREDSRQNLDQISRFASYQNRSNSPLAQQLGVTKTRDERISWLGSNEYLQARPAGDRCCMSVDVNSINNSNKLTRTHSNLNLSCASLSDSFSSSNIQRCSKPGDSILDLINYAMTPYGCTSLGGDEDDDVFADNHGNRMLQRQRSQSVPDALNTSVNLEGKGRSPSGATPPNSPRVKQRTKSVSHTIHRQRSQLARDDEVVKRSRAHSSTYELSEDIQAKQVEMLERKYGGHLRARHAALIIQRAYRKYSMEKQFQNICSIKSDRRLSRRYFSMREPSFNNPLLEGQQDRRRFVCREYNQNFMIVERNDNYLHHVQRSYEQNHNYALSVQRDVTRGREPHHAGRARDFDIHNASVADKVNRNNSSSAIVGALKRSVSRDRLKGKAVRDSSREQTLEDVYGVKPLSPAVDHKQQKRSRSKERKSANYIKPERPCVTSPHAVTLKTPRSKSLDRNAASTTRRQLAFSPTVAYDARRKAPSPVKCDMIDSKARSKSKERSRSSDRHKIHKVVPMSKEAPRARGDSPRAVISGDSSRPVMTASPRTVINDSPRAVVGDSLHSKRTLQPDRSVCHNFDMPERAPPIPKHAREREEDKQHRMRSSSLDGSIILDSSATHVTDISSDEPVNWTNVLPSGGRNNELRSCSSDLSNKSESDEYVGYERNETDLISPVWKRKGPSQYLVSSHEVAPMNRNSNVSDVSGETDSLDETTYSSSPTSDSLMNGNTQKEIIRHGAEQNVPITFRVSDVQRKRQYRVGLNLFNKKPERGIRYLVEHRFVDYSPQPIAKFLITRKGLSKQKIGEFLGNLQSDFAQQVLDAFVDEIDLSNLEVDTALRKFQSYFRLPGEAQKIERLMEAFGQRYCVCNPSIVCKLHSSDTVFILAFGIIMLNTDLHSPNVKLERKMKVEDFIKNLGGIDDGHDLEEDMLRGIYERIKNCELKSALDHCSQVMKVEQTIVGKKPILALPHRRLVCYCRLYEVPDINKREKPGLHQREVFLFNDLIVITKIFTKKKGAVTYSYRQSFPLCGMQVNTFENSYYQNGLKLIQALDNKVLIIFNARNEHDRSKFTEDLRESICEMDEMESLRIDDELQKHKMSRNNRNKDYLSSRDSGVVEDGESLESRASAPDRLSVDSGHLKRSALSNSLLDLADQGGKLKRRGSAGSLDSGMSSTTSSISRDSSPQTSKQNAAGKSPNPSFKFGGIFAKKEKDRFSPCPSLTAPPPQLAVTDSKQDVKSVTTDSTEV